MLAFAALLANGCGTICNLASGEDMKRWGGLHKDLGPFDSEAIPPKSSSPITCHDAKGAIVLLAIVAAIGVGFVTVELPMTFIGDTATLPLTG